MRGRRGDMRAVNLGGKQKPALEEEAAETVEVAVGAAATETTQNHQASWWCPK